MIFSFDKVSSVKGHFREFLLQVFYNGEWKCSKKVYFRNEKDFYHWVQDLNRQCTGKCSVWSYTGEMSENHHWFTPLEIWENHDFSHLLFYSDTVTYSFDFIQ